jgi:Protein of unknown function (DUF2934)
MPRASKPNKDEIESKVRERAYGFWEAEGRLHGRDVEHWLRAETELSLPKKPRVRKTVATKGSEVPRTAKPTRTKRKPKPSTSRKKRES